MALFFCPKSGDDSEQQNKNKNKNKRGRKMDFENFKEQFTEDVGKALYDRGIDAAVTTNTVEKMNESYEALTITPEGSHVGE